MVASAFALSASYMGRPDASQGLSARAQAGSQSVAKLCLSDDLGGSSAPQAAIGTEFATT
jgi:hypothetical protein